MKTTPQQLQQRQDHEQPPTAKEQYLARLHDLTNDLLNQPATDVQAAQLQSVAGMFLTMLQDFSLDEVDALFKKHLGDYYVD